MGICADFPTYDPAPGNLPEYRGTFLDLFVRFGYWIMARVSDKAVYFLDTGDSQDLLFRVRQQCKEYFLLSDCIRLVNILGVLFF